MKPFWITISVRIEADNVDEARSIGYELLEFGSEDTDVCLEDVTISVDED